MSDGNFRQMMNICNRYGLCVTIKMPHEINDINGILLTITNQKTGKTLGKSFIEMPDEGPTDL